jgi:hypothetical protein
VTKKKEEVAAEAAASDPDKPLGNLEDPLQSEFFETDVAAPTNPQPAGVDDNLGFLQSDGQALGAPPPASGKVGRKPKVGDEVLYCTGMKDTGQKGEDGNRILEPEYAPATIYQVDEDRTATGHVLLVYEHRDHGKQPAWAHQGDANPGYWTTKKPE